MNEVVVVFGGVLCLFVFAFLLFCLGGGGLLCFVFVSLFFIMLAGGLFLVFGFVGFLLLFLCVCVCVFCCCFLFVFWGCDDACRIGLCLNGVQWLTCGDWHRVSRNHMAVRSLKKVFGLK